MTNNLKNTFFKLISAVIAFTCSLLLIAVLFFMLRESLPVWQMTSPLAFLSGTDWSPVYPPIHLGIGSMLASTLWVAFGALIIAIPLALGCAIFLAEYAPEWLAQLLRPALTVLTGIPSVVYGFLGAAVLVKFFEIKFQAASGESLFAASIVLAFMVLPYIVVNSESAIRAVPPEYKHSALAVGVSKPYVTMKVIVPLAKKGVLGSIALAFGRAAGETMAVLMIAGNVLRFPGSWFSRGEPLSALIALEIGSAAPHSLHYQALFAVGLVLILVVTIINISINYLVKNKEMSRYWL
ncbi:MAG: phosphate ABC transporter permease subunit PstC [Syntrophomonadaceae bacterium]|nr:phosphate ABC transporter permease subunit PstC [Syntrophomonadaceae bacterium]